MRFEGRPRDMGRSRPPIGRTPMEEIGNEAEMKDMQPDIDSIPASAPRNIKTNEATSNSNISTSTSDSNINNDAKDYTQHTFSSILQLYLQSKVVVGFLILILLINIFISISLAPYILDIVYMANHINLFGFNITLFNYLLMISLFVLYIYVVIGVLLGTNKRAPILMIIYFIVIIVVLTINFWINNYITNVILIFVLQLLLFFEIFFGQYLFKPVKGILTNPKEDFLDINNNNITISVENTTPIFDLAEEILTKDDVVEPEDKESILEDIMLDIKDIIADISGIRYLFVDPPRLVGLSIINKRKDIIDEEDYEDISFNNSINEEVIPDMNQSDNNDSYEEITDEPKEGKYEEDDLENKNNDNKTTIIETEDKIDSNETNTQKIEEVSSNKRKKNKDEDKNKNKNETLMEIDDILEDLDSLL